MSKNPFAKYYKENKERPQKRIVKDTKILLKNKKKEKQQYGCERCSAPCNPIFCSCLIKCPVLMSVQSWEKSFS